MPLIDRGWSLGRELARHVLGISTRNPRAGCIQTAITSVMGRLV